MTVIISIGLFLLAVLAVLAVSPAHATDRHEEPPVATPSPASSVPVGKKKSTRWQLPVIIIGAGVVCWFYCGDEAPKEPLPDLGPALKVTPDNLQDNHYLIEVK
jgi:hypothetical protein